MRITSGGNVLIGTTTDAGYKLDITGTGRFTGVLSANNTITIGNGTTAANSSISLLGVAGVSYTWSITNDANGLSFGGGTSPSFRLDGATGAATFSSSVTANSNSTINGGGGDVLVVNGNSSTNTMRASSSGGAASRFINLVSNVIENGSQVDIRTHGSTYTETLFGNSMTNAGAILGQPASGAVFAIGNYNNGALVLGTNNAERMRITSGGEILVNTTTDAGAYYLQVNGSVYATAYYESSDLRKKNVLSERVGSDGINTITFKWKDGRDSLTHIGYAAQQVEKVLPDAVKTNPDGYKTINYDEVQTLKIANLEKEIAELKEMIKKLIK